MNDRLGFLTVSGAVGAVVALAALLGWVMLSGLTPFSPGGLNAMARTQPLGGVVSHAELGGHCEACHTAPWDAQTMTDRCVACHKDVGTQMQARNGMHGSMVEVRSSRGCGTCHSEHAGPRGALTANFDHNSLPFKLTGKHAAVSCDLCHTTARSAQGMQNTPRDCFACHAKDDKHGGTFGQQCGQCHNPSGWANASFDHKIFPINHGNEGGGTNACKTCHPNGPSTYTCYGCHEHTPANVQADHRGQTLASLADCIRCHPGGRGGD